MDKHEGHPVLLHQNFRDLGHFTSSMLRPSGWIGTIISGTVLILLIAALLGPRGAEIRGTPEAIAMGIGLAFFIVVLLVSLRVALRPIPREQLLRAKHLFVITSDTLEFPGVPKRAAESWPLDRTTTESTDGRGGRLVLRCPGFAPRRYLAASMQESPKEVQARIMAAQRALAEETR